MRSLLTKKLPFIFPQKIAIVKLSGPINTSNTYQFMNELNCIKLSSISALAIHVDSLGGSPAQADIISSRLIGLKNKYGFRLYGFVSDVAVSAGYAVLAAADQIYAHDLAVVGSIGAVLKKYDITKLLQQYDMGSICISSNRTLKQMMNPTIPPLPEDTHIFQQLCNNTHTKFIEYIKQRRIHKLPKQQDKLKQIFNGSTFYGNKAMQYGLIDGFGHYSQVLGRKYPNARIVEGLLKEPNRKFFI